MNVPIKAFRDGGGLFLPDRDPQLPSITEYDGPRAVGGRSDRKFKFELAGYYVQFMTTRATPLHSPGVVAPGLTEACMRARWGKVFWVPKPDAKEQDMDKGYYELPELLYVDYGWGDKDAEQWIGLSHVERLQLLNACADGIARKDVVLTISMRFSKQESTLVELNPSSKCAAGLHIDGDIHMGHYNDLIAGGSHQATNTEELANNWVHENDKRAFRYHSFQDVADGLERLFATSPNLRFHEDFLKLMITTHNNWNHQAIAAVNPGPNDSSNATRKAPQFIPQDQ